MGCSGFKPSPAPLNDLKKKGAATDHTVCDDLIVVIVLRWRVSPAHANNLEFSSVRSHELKYKFTSSLHPSMAPPRYKCSITFAKEYL